MVGYIINRIKAFGHAFNGIGLFFKESSHARIHLVALLIVSALAYYYDLARWEWVALFLAYGLILGLEALNSGIEYVVDLASPDYHDLAKKAKDVSAAAVLLASFCMVAVALFIFWPHIAF